MIVKDTPKACNILHAAERYLAMGYPVFPASRSKRPAIKAGDTWMREFSRWEFRDCPCIALRSGVLIPDLGHVVCIDFDSDNEPLFRQFCNDLEQYGITATLTVRTGGHHHGWHLYCLTATLPGPTKKIKYHGASVEFRGESSYTLIPPSIVDRPYRSDKGVVDLSGCQSITLDTWKTCQTQLCDKLSVLNNSLMSQEGNNTMNIHSIVTPDSPIHSIVTPTGYRDKVLWGKLIKKFYEQVYPEEKFTIKWNGKENSQTSCFRCVLYPEDKPSVALFTGENGNIMYHDFREIIPGKKFYQLEEVYKKFYQQQGADAGGLNWYESWRNIVLEFDYWNPAAVLMEKQWTAMKDQLTILGAPTLITAEAVLNEALVAARIGRSKFLAAARYIAEKTGLPKEKVNRSMNLLCCLGLIVKGDSVSLSGGRTYWYSVNSKMSVESILERFECLKRAGYKGLKTFTRRIEERAFGMSVRRRQPD